jgi:hypothetical protein
MKGTYLLTLVLLILVLRGTSASASFAEKKLILTVVLIEGTQSQKTCYASTERSVSSHTLVAGGDTVCHTCTSDTTCVSAVAGISLH